MIQRALLEDAAAIASIHVRAWQVAYAGIVPADFLAGMSLEKRTGFWTEELAGNGRIVVTAIENGEVVGWASGGGSRDADANGESEVYAIYVSPDYWTRGIGGQLLMKIEEELLPCPSLTLWVLARNRRAIGFYRKMGYELDGAEKTIQIGGVSLAEVRLRKCPTARPPHERLIGSVTE